MQCPQNDKKGNQIMQDKFSHFDNEGNAIMVDVSDKSITQRIAVASGCIIVCQEIMDAINRITSYNVCYTKLLRVMEF